MSNVAPQANDWLQPDSPVSRLIMAKAARLSRSTGFCPSDVDDIAQELRLAIWQQQKRHDEHRSSFATFAERVATGRTVSIVRSRRARKRGAGRLPAPLTHEPVARDQSTNQKDLQLDLAAALIHVSDELRELADHLQRHSLHSAGKCLQRSRRDLHRQRQQLRRALEDASLQDYLPPSAQSHARSA